MWQNWSDFQGFIGAILTYVTISAGAIGFIGAITLWLFKLFGEKWMAARFDERLAAYKHAQQAELEKLKFEINKLMDRTVKLHQKEFEVIPEAWGLLNDAFNIVRPVALGLAFSPNVNMMLPGQFEYFLEQIPLAAWQKDELRNAPDKTMYYCDAIVWHDFNRAQDSCGQFHIYLTKNGIFIPAELMAKFSALDDLLSEVVGERRFSLRYAEIAQKFEKGVILHETGPELLRSLGQNVQSRLWSVANAGSGLE